MSYLSISSMPGKERYIILHIDRKLKVSIIYNSHSKYLSGRGKWQKFETFFLAQISENKKRINWRAFSEESTLEKISINITQQNAG